MARRRLGVSIASIGVAIVAVIALALCLGTGGSGGMSAGKRGPGDPEALEHLSVADGPGEGPFGGYEAEKAARADLSGGCDSPRCVSGGKEDVRKASEVVHGPR